MTQHPTPEEFVSRSAEAPLELTLKCNHCGLEYLGKFDWACVNPRREIEDSKWDGVLLSRIVECTGCGEVDDYTLAAHSFDRLMAGTLALRSLGKRPDQGRIILGVSQLWDGSIARRPSQALARLRQRVRVIFQRHDPTQEVSVSGS